jgi:hypothetical protein
VAAFRNRDPDTTSARLYNNILPPSGMGQKADYYLMRVSQGRSCHQKRRLICISVNPTGFRPSCMGGSRKQTRRQVVGSVPAAEDYRANRSDVAIYGEYRQFLKAAKQIADRFRSFVDAIRRFWLRLGRHSRFKRAMTRRHLFLLRSNQI